ncbi:MAG TPA: DUF2771 family protein [Pseudonocardiaceae bacterium]
MRPPAILAVLVALTTLTAACTGRDDTPPRVTFSAAGNTAVAGPTQLCDVQVQNCTADPKAAVVLRVPRGQPLEISVPKAIGETPWLVVFGYRTGSGEKVSARSDVFASNERHAYTLVLPDADAQLETAEVQQLGGTLIQGRDGIDFPTRGTWVLSVDDR